MTDAYPTPHAYIDPYARIEELEAQVKTLTSQRNRSRRRVSSAERRNRELLERTGDNK